MGIAETLRNRKRKKNKPEIPPRVVAPIAPIAVDLSTRPWDATGLSLSEQLHERAGQNFRGEGVLMRASTEQLRDIFRAIVTERGKQEHNLWTPDQQKLVLDVADFVTQTHEGQTRKYDTTPYEHHLLRIAARAAQMEIGNPHMVAVALLHDAPEDHGVTLEKMKNYFKETKGYDTEDPSISATLTKLFEGANALNTKKPGGGEFTNKQYYKNIDTVNKKYPDLHVWALKGLDRLDNLISDISPAVRHKEIDGTDKIRRADAKKIKKTIEEKMLPVVTRVRRNEPTAGVLELIDEAVTLGSDMMKDWNLKVKRGFMGGTIFMTGQVFSLGK
jgi:hypothetical protein